MATDAEGFQIFDPPVTVIRWIRDPLPYFELYAVRFLFDPLVRKLSLEKKGVYVILLAEQWINRGVLPSDWQAVAKQVLGTCKQLDGLQQFFGKSACGQYLLNLKLYRMYEGKEHSRAQKVRSGSAGGKMKSHNVNVAGAKQVLSTKPIVLRLEERRGEEKKRKENPPPPPPAGGGGERTDFPGAPLNQGPGLTGLAESIQVTWGLSGKTKTQRQRLESLAKELAAQGCGGQADLELARTKYAENFKDAACTPEALARHYSALMNGTLRPAKPSLAERARAARKETSG